MLKYIKFKLVMLSVNRRISIFVLLILKWIRQAHHPEFTEGQVQDDGFCETNLIS